MTDSFCIKDGVLEAYIHSETIIKIPDTVHTIGKNAFKGHVGIEEVILPETIINIMENAFKGCKKLNKINFPSNLTYIGEYAFHRCHSLHRVELPSTIKTLNNCVFLYCDNLEYVSIPGVIRMGKQVFLNDINLRTLELNVDLERSDLCDVFTGSSRLSKFCLSDGTIFEIENIIDIISLHPGPHPLIKAIATDIFRMLEIEDGILLKFLTNLKHVEIPYGITGIGKSCFFDKKGIISVKLPGTVTHIGSKAFRNCINLEKMELANEHIEISPDAFKNCTTLKHITTFDGKEYELKGLSNASNGSAPSMIRTIHSQILNNFYISGTTLIQYRGNEDRVIVPEGITIIGEKAFSGSETIDRIVLPESVRRICEEAFSDCLLLQTINFPENLKYIGVSAFENCVKLIRAELPEALTTIEKSTFSRCRKLNEVKFGTNIERIEHLAFYSCQVLKKVHLPEKLTYIGDMAFYRCLMLKSITLPKTIKELGNNVFTSSGVKSVLVQSRLKACGTDIFSQCEKLKTLTFDQRVTSIGDKFAFQCTSLKYVDVPSSIGYIGRNAFEGSIYLTQMIQNGSIGHIFIDGSKCSGNVTIPDGITVIAGGAFYGNTAITGVTLPESLTQIGARTFCGCTSLTEMVLPGGVKTLEEGVFAYCSSLRNVVSRGSILSIADNAFYKCSTVSGVPSSKAEYIGKSGFQGCEKLDTIEINTSNLQEDAFKNTAFLNRLRKQSPLVIIGNAIADGEFCEGNLVIPEGILHIAPSAFAGNETITHITCPNGLTVIGESAFYGCRNLKTITFQSKLKRIGRNAFEKCISLTEVFASVEEIAEGAYSYCINLKNAIIEDTRSFGKEVFCGCEALETCQCNNLEIIGDYCFSNCSSLQEFDFSNIKAMGNYSFFGCHSLECISLNGDTSVAGHAFEDCGSLKEIKLSHERLKYESYAFSGATALRTIGIGEKKYRTDRYEVLFDQDIPNSIKAIYNSTISCFQIDENLSLYGYINQGRYIHIPEGVKRIESGVFKNAVNIEEISIPKSVEYIGARAFHSTIWLEKQTLLSPMVIVNHILIDASKCVGDVVIPDVDRISGWAFANCLALTGVRFTSPKTVVEEYAFRNCINIKNVTTSDHTTYGLTKLSDKDDELPYMVKQIFMDCFHCFKTDEQNSLIECTGNLSHLTLPKGIVEIGNNVFKNAKLLTHIILTEDIIRIGRCAFEQCTWMTSVYHASHVKRIEKQAFSGCALLEKIEISNELTYIGERAFEHCRSLTSMIIPEGVTEIPEKAFYRCKQLKKVSLPSTLRTIGKEAFAFCYNLQEINFPEKLEYIDTRAFTWCSYVNSKNLSKSVLIQKDSFGGGTL